MSALTSMSSALFICPASLISNSGERADSWMPPRVKRPAFLSKRTEALPPLSDVRVGSGRVGSGRVEADVPLVGALEEVRCCAGGA
jgi:hypothetical protein